MQLGLIGPELLRACADEVSSVCLVKECVELQELFGCVVGEKLLQEKMLILDL